MAWLLQSYAGATVEVAISAVISRHILNRCGNSVKKDARLGKICRAIERTAAKHVWRAFQELPQPRRFDEVRTMAWLLVGFECGLRVREVCQLTVFCWKHLAQGHVYLMVLDTKNNRNMAIERSKSRLARAEEPLARHPSVLCRRCTYRCWRPWVRNDIRAAGQGWSMSIAKCKLCPKLFPMCPRQQKLGTMMNTEIRSKTQGLAQPVGDPEWLMYSGIS